MISAVRFESGACDFIAEGPVPERVS